MSHHLLRIVLSLAVISALFAGCSGGSNAPPPENRPTKKSAKTAPEWLKEVPPLIEATFNNTTRDDELALTASGLLNKPAHEMRQQLEAYRAAYKSAGGRPEIRVVGYEVGSFEFPTAVKETAKPERVNAVQQVYCTISKDTQPKREDIFIVWMVQTEFGLRVLAFGPL